MVLVHLLSLAWRCALTLLRRAKPLACSYFFANARVRLIRKGLKGIDFLRPTTHGLALGCPPVHGKTTRRRVFASKVLSSLVWEGAGSFRI